MWARAGCASASVTAYAFSGLRRPYAFILFWRVARLTPRALAAWVTLPPVLARASRMVCFSTSSVETRASPRRSFGLLDGASASPRSSRGTSSSPTMSPLATTIVRWTTFSSSRTLPGH